MEITLTQEELTALVGLVRKKRSFEVTKMYKKIFVDNEIGRDRKMSKVVNMKDKTVTYHISEHDAIKAASFLVNIIGDAEEVKRDINPFSKVAKIKKLASTFGM
jgi:hypothetical protein